MTISRPGCGGLGHMAVGYWGRDIHRQVLAEQEQAKQRALLSDQLSAGGLRTNLWQVVRTGTRCACYKESNQQADRKCKSCHGSSLVPGFLKFGYTTLWMSAVDSDVTMSDVELSSEFKSAKVQLASTATIGSIESGDKPFSRTAIGSIWESQEISFTRVPASSSVTVYYSLDSGASWSPISDLVTANPSSGTIRFKAVLTRLTTSVLSPLFEIVRARFSKVDLRDLQDNGTYRWGPWILTLRSQPFKQLTKGEHGDQPDHGAPTFWTSGLSMFDSSITIGSTGELMRGESELVEFLDGVLAGARWIVTSRQHGDPFGYIIVEQSFTARMSDTVDAYSLVW